jgi:T5SS/PEP-CTERM-associated repeat protein
LRTTTIYIGLSGSSNSVTISNGGSLFDITGYLGYNASATGNSVTVTGPGSVWSNSTFVTVGRNSPGSSLTISDGGTVIASNMYMGAYATATGSVVSVSGGNLYLTNITRDAQLDVRWATFSLNSGTVLVNRLYVTNNANSVVNFSAGLLRSGGSSVSNGVTFAVGDGTQSATLDLLGGTHRFANGLSISTNANLIGNGDILGSATNFGVIAPGHSAGTLTFSGDLTLTDSSALNFEIGGNTTNDYDRVWVGGILRIGGLLNMVLTNDYTGNAGDTFDLFNFSSATGTFSQTNLPSLGSGMAWNTDRLYTQGEIQIIPEPGACSLLALGLAVLSRRHRSARQRRGR